MIQTKRHLGDAVYADLENRRIRLTTESDTGASNTIYLDIEVFEALVDYAKWIGIDI